MKHLIALLMLVGSAFGQAGGLISQTAYAKNGIANATVRVCTYTTSPAVPCNASIAIYSDVNLSQQITNPTISDASGNVSIFAAGGIYICQFAKAGYTTKSIPCTANAQNNSAITLVSQNVWTGINDFTGGFKTYPWYDVKAYGAKVDGKYLGEGGVLSEQSNGTLATASSGCAINIGQPTLTCPSGTFSSGDVGKVIAVYEAGPTRNGFLQPLSTTIAGFVGSSQVNLTANAGATVSNSSHVVWGTNDDTALQAAVDAAASAGGGIVYAPSGTSLTHGVHLDCSAIGNFSGSGYENCTRAYNNIQIKGASRDKSRWENWDIASTSSAPTSGGGNIALIVLGQSAEVPGVVAGMGRLHDVTVSDLTLWQVAQGTNSVKALYTYAADRFTAYNLTFYNPSYECYVVGGGDKTTNYFLRDSRFLMCGQGGPAISTSNSAVNANGNYGLVENNRIQQTGQCVETAGHDTQYGPGNYCDCRNNNNASPVDAVNVSSGNQGEWNIRVKSNTFVGCGGGIVAENVLGIFENLIVDGNLFVDSGFVTAGGGKEANNVVEGVQPPTPHGTSVVSQNVIIYTSAIAPATYTFNVGNGNQQPTLENWIFDNNTIAYQSQMCTTSPRQACTFDSECNGGGTCQIPSGFLAVGPNFGGPKWTPSKSVALTGATSSIVPNVDNGFIYVATVAGITGTTEPTFCTTSACTVVDGGVTWKLYGLRPFARVSNLALEAPVGSKPRNSTDSEITLYNGTSRESVILRNISYGNSIRISVNGGTGSTDDQADILTGIPGALDDQNTLWTLRTDDTKPPNFGKFAIGQTVYKRSPGATGVQSWRITTAGFTAPIWTVSQSCPLGTMVAPTTADGHFFRATNTATGTAGGSEPSWSTGTGTTTADGSCTWTESGTAAVFSPSPTVTDVFTGTCSGTATSSQSTLGLLGLGQVSALTCTAVADDTAGALPMPSAGTVLNLRVKCGTAGTNASSGAFTAYKNGSSQTLTCTVGTGTTCSDTTHSFAVVAADRIAVAFSTQGSETLANCRATLEKQ